MSDQHICVVTDYSEVSPLCDGVRVVVANPELPLFQQVAAGLTPAADFVIVLGADTPVRPPDVLSRVAKELTIPSVDVVVTVSQIPLTYHPYRSGQLTPTGVFIPDQQANIDIPSQTYPPRYSAVGGAVGVAVCSLPRLAVVGQYHSSLITRSVVCEPGSVLEIDTPEDLDRFRSQVNADPAVS